MQMPLSLNPHRKKALDRAFIAQSVEQYALHFLRAVDEGEDPTESFEGPLEDDYRDFAHAALSEHFAKARGYVYAAAYPLREGVFKVGRTRLSVEARQTTLESSGVLVPLRMSTAIYCNDSYFSERMAHKLLHRGHIRKEFFEVPVLALGAVLEHCLRLDNIRYETVGRYLAW